MADEQEIRVAITGVERDLRQALASAEGDPAGVRAAIDRVSLGRSESDGQQVRVVLAGLEAGELLALGRLGANVGVTVMVLAATPAR